MKISAIVIGGLAVLTAALPAVENSKPTGLNIAGDNAGFAEVFEPHDPDTELKRRKAVKTPPKNTPVKSPVVKTPVVNNPPVKTPVVHTSPAHTPVVQSHTTKAVLTNSTPSKSAHSSTLQSSSKASSAVSSRTSSISTHTGTASTAASSLSTTFATATTSAAPTEHFCGPKTCGKKGCLAPTATSTGSTTKPTKTVKPVKPVKPTAQPKTSRSLGDVARDLFDRASSFVRRVNTINLSVTQIEAARAQGRAVSKTVEIHTGKYRYLKMGTGVVDVEPTDIARTPNDQSFDTWGSDSEFFRTIDGLRGCTALMVTSPRGVFAAHLWETHMRDKNTGFPAQLANLVKGAKDKQLPITKLRPIPFWDARAQFGLNDFAAGKVASDAWKVGAGAQDIHIAIFTPSNDPKGRSETATHSGLKTPDQWASSLKYPAEITQVLKTIRGAVGNVPDTNVVTYAYHQQSENEAETSVDIRGTMTAYFNNGNYAVYSEGTKMFEFAAGPPAPAGEAPSGGDSGSGSPPACDSSDDCKTGCCVVQK